MNHCPDEETLIKMGLGQLSDERRRPLGTHVDHCVRCQAVIELVESMPPTDCGEGIPDEIARAITSGMLQSVDEQPQEIAGYRIVEALGKGGMGTVWRAVQERTKRDVALKLINVESFDSPSARIRFEREVELAAMLEHPNIAQVFEAGIENETHYYAMQLVDGTTLGEYVANEKLAQREIVQLMLPVCRAVEAAHRRGVIHRDLKPANVVVSYQGHPFVLDFGLAKSLREDVSDVLRTREGQITGTPAYMAPEQAIGDVNSVDTRSDVYALGVMLFRLLTGDMPHDVSGSKFDVLRRIVDDEIRRPRQVRADIDPELEAILLKTLAKKQSDRYGSAGSLANDLERFLNGDPIDAHPPTVLYYLSKRLQKHRMALAATAIVLIGLVSLVAYGYVRERDLRSKAENAKLDALDKEGEAIAAAARAKREQGNAIAAAEKAKAAESKATREAERASLAEQRAHAEAEKARQQLYFNRIALASQYCQTGRWWKASGLLDDCPKHLRHWEWGFLKQQTDRLVGRVNVGGHASCFRFTSGGDLLFVGTWNGVLKLIDANSCRELWSLKTPDTKIYSIFVAENGRVAFAGSNDQMQILDFGSSWEKLLPASRHHSGESQIQPSMIRQFSVEPTGKTEQAPACTLSADGSKVARVIDRTIVIVNDVDSGKELYRCVGHAERVTDVAFSRSENFIATVAIDDSAKIWNDGGELRHALSIPTERCLPQLRLTQDGSTLFVATRRLSIIDTETGELKESMRPARYDGIDLSSDGDTMVLREFDDLTSVVDRKTRRTLHPCRSGSQHEFAISGDGRRLAHPILRSDDILIVDISSETRATSLYDGVSAANPVTDMFAVSKVPGRVLLCNKKGHAIRELDTGDTSIREMRFSSDGKMLAVRAGGEQTTLWDVHSGNQCDEKVIPNATGTQTKADLHSQFTMFNDSGKTYAVTKQGEFAVWEHQSNELFNQLARVTESSGIKVGQQITAFLDGTNHIEVRNRSSLDLLYRFEHRNTFRWSISPDDRLLVAANYGSVCSMWDLETGKLLYQINNAQGPFAFSPDCSRLLAFASQTRDRKNTLRLIEARSGNEIMQWEGVQRSNIQFSPDSRHVISSIEHSRSSLLLGERLNKWHEGTEHDLLQFVDPHRDRVAGRWKREGEAVASAAGASSKIRIPVQPMGSYQFTAKFTRRSGNETIGFYLPVGQKNVMLAIDSWHSKGGFTKLSGPRSSPDTIHGFHLTNGTESTVVADVSSDGIRGSVQVTLDGQQLFDWDGLIESIGSHSQFGMGKPVLGLHVHDSEAVFQSAKLKLLTEGAHLHFDSLTRPIATGSEVDLLPNVLVERDTEQGVWIPDNTGIATSNRGHDVLLMPLQVHGSYEFSVDFTPLENGEAFSLLLPTNNALVAAEVNGDSGFAGLNSIDGLRTDDNETATKIAPLVLGNSYHLTARVEALDAGRVKIELKLNDDSLLTWTGEEDRLGCSTVLSQTHRPAISSFKSMARVTGIKFRLIDGIANRIDPRD